MTSEDDNNTVNRLAAEYVLGTLNHRERQSVTSQRLTNSELHLAIIAWEKRLSPLNDYIKNANPRDDLLADILEKLDSKESLNRPNTSLKSHSSSTATVTDIQLLRLHVSRWRNAALAASALAAGLAAFILVKPTVPFSANQPFVAVFQADDQQPAFIMSIDIDKRQLTVRPITAEGHPGKTYQLWIKADEIGPTPRSLGLLASLSEPIKKQLEYDPAIIRHATFGISIEPEGGSPTGVPTGPAIHGKLYPTTL